jgi:hypothetical protein
MSMHHGILAVELPWAELLARLSPRAGAFLDQGPVESIEALELDLDPGDDDSAYRIVGGEHLGRSYVLDGSFRLTLHDPDFLLRLSEETGALVVGCGAETMSGSYSFLAARSGELLRYYYDCQALISEPFEEGDPLPTEAELPFDDFDGRGLLAGLAHFGFDYDGWYQGGLRRSFRYTPAGADAAETLVEGSLGMRRADHVIRYELPADQRPPIMMFTRDAVTGQIVASQDTGLRLGDGKTDDPEVWKSFWKRTVN